MDWARKIGFALLILLATGYLLLFCGCAVKGPVRAEKSSFDELAHIYRSEVPIISIDGRECSEPLYKVSLEPGLRLIIVEYRTVLARYHCTFHMVLEAGKTYEIIKRSDSFPVFLNRIKKGTIFTRRPERHPPSECTRRKSANDS